MAKLLLLRGLPGSGKSTKAKYFISNGDYHAHFEADMFHVSREGEYEFTPELIADSHEWCQNKTKEVLSAGLNVVVSNTFVQKWEMQFYIDLATELGAELIIKTVKGNYGSVHSVPDMVLERMRSNWEN